MGEVIHGDYSRWANDETLHSVTNYELHKGLYSGHNDHNYFEIAHTIRREFDENGGIYRGMKLYSFVDNHDVDRIASKLQDQACLIPVHALLYFLPGIPSVYYDSEFGISGRKEGGNDAPLRPALSLKELEKEAPHPELAEWIRQISKIRKKHPACTEGRYQELLLTNRQYAFCRYSDSDYLLVAVNNDPQETEVQIPVEGAFTYTNVLTKEEAPVENGRVAVKLPACGCVLLERV